MAKPEKSGFDPKEVRGNVLKHLLQPENLSDNTYSVSCKSKLYVRLIATVSCIQILSVLLLKNFFNHSHNNGFSLLRTYGHLIRSQRHISIVLTLYIADTECHL